MYYSFDRKLSVRYKLVSSITIACGILSLICALWKIQSLILPFLTFFAIGCVLLFILTLIEKTSFHYEVQVNSDTFRIRVEDDKYHSYSKNCQVQFKKQKVIISDNENSDVYYYNKEFKEFLEGLQN